MSVAPRFSADQRRGLPPLLDQQFFCWGQDVKHPRGNLLLARGFTRERPAAGDGRGGCSRYQITTAGGAELTLWGFGALWREGDSGIYVPRRAFPPRLLRADSADALTGVWLATDLFGVTDPAEGDRLARAVPALAAFCAWVADYEEWIVGAAGVRWREEAVRVWWKPRTPARALPDAWRNFAMLCETDKA